MKPIALSTLLETLGADPAQALAPRHVAGPIDCEVSDIQFDSGSVQPGDLFVARRGQVTDGHKYIEDAVNHGAAAIVAERIPEGTYTRNASVYLVRDSRLAEALLAARRYGSPAPGQKIAAVTGTNGKTTTTYLLEAIGNAAGLGTGVIGTVSYRWQGHSVPSGHTTPESVTLHRMLRRMADDGVSFVAMEASSHALDQDRLAGLKADVAGFTNITRDHLDYHKTFENYFEAKRKLFTHVLSPAGKAVVSRDDPYGLNLIAILEGRVITTSISPDASADIKPLKAKLDLHGITAQVQVPGAKLDITSPLVGQFNLANLMTAIGMAVALKLPHDAIVKGLASALGAPGRMERIANDHGVVCLVDYAHTPDALERVLAELKGVRKKRVIAVFGCGGDRDRGKRPQMGQCAGDLADITIITSDNPRTEKPEEIIDDILPGMRSTGARQVALADLAATAPRDQVFAIEPDRRRAIEGAIAAAAADDIVLIAGKGHEDYQEINRIRHRFSDRDEALKAFTAKTA
jgi:UDP-N-acetylmuramoyl-L-alanyl-D-glutamate--2,6-diaminopimelate ligase